MVCLKRRLSRRQNLGVIWFLAESRHVGRVGDFPDPVHHEGRPAQNARLFDETAVFCAEISTHVVRKDGNLIHTGRTTPAFLSKGQVGADDQDGNILVQCCGFLVETTGLAVTDFSIQRRNSRNDADFARCVRQSIIWRPVRVWTENSGATSPGFRSGPRTVTACPLNLTIPKRSVIIFPPAPPNSPPFPEKWRMVRVRGAPLAGFEPTTYCLEGRCSVR